MIFCKPNKELAKQAESQSQRLAALEKLVLHLGVKILSNQQKLDEEVVALSNAIDGIEAEIATLKAQPAAETLDFTSLDALVTRLKEDAAPAEPVEPAVPAEPAPAEPVPDEPVVDEPVVDEPVGEPV